MTRYDPHPQAHDDARTGRSGSTDRRESDETGPGVPEEGGGLREALEALAVSFDASADNLSRAVRNQRPEPARRLSREWSQRAEAWRLAAHGLREVLAAHPADAPAGPEPDPFLAEIRAAVDAADRDAPQRCGHSSEPMCCPFENFPTLAAWFRQATADAPAEGWPVGSPGKPWNPTLGPDAYWHHVHKALDLPTPAQAPEPSGDVVERAARVIDLAMREAVPEEKSPIPGPDSVDRFVAQSLADAGLLVDPEVSERAERLPRLYRDLDGMRLLRDEAVGERDRARQLAAALEADNARLTEERDEARAGWQRMSDYADYRGARVAELEAEDPAAAEHYRVCDRRAWVERAYAAERQRDEARARVAELEAEVERWQQRMWASVRERMVWQHENGEHQGDLPFYCCPMCERTAAEAGARRAEDALWAVRDKLTYAVKPCSDPDCSYCMERREAVNPALTVANAALSATDQTSDATPSDGGE